MKVLDKLTSLDLSNNRLLDIFTPVDLRTLLPRLDILNGINREGEEVNSDMDDSEEEDDAEGEGDGEGESDDEVDEGIEDA